MTRLRHGRHHPQIVYSQQGDEPSDSDEMVAVCMNEFLAAAIISMVNRRAVGNAEEAAVGYWLEKLAALDRLIATNADERFPIHRQMNEERLIPERKHLAVLLRTLGVDVEDLPEEKK